MKPISLNRSKCRRRGFLHVGSLSMLGIGLSDVLLADSVAVADSSKAKNVIMIWLAGGPATIDMWDMKPNAPTGIRGEYSPISTSVDGIQICEHLPKLAKVMDQCCLVRSCHHTLAAHGPGTELLLTGNRPKPSLTYPSLGSIASKTLSPVPGVPSFIAMGDGADVGSGFLGAAYNPFSADVANTGFGGAGTAVGLPDGFSVDDLTRRGALLAKLDRSMDRLASSPVAQQLDKFQHQAIDILRSDRTRVALDVSQATQRKREIYGNRRLGLRLLAARRLVEAGVRFVTVGIEGWDTHANNFGSLRALLPQLDSALAGLIEDLRQRGLFDSTLIYCAGEFGRTPHINGSGGRDHWARAMSVLLAGGPVRRGWAYGSTDADGFEPLDQPCTPMDVSATVLASLGISPQSRLHTPSGRPLPAIADGSVIDGLLG